MKNKGLSTQNSYNQIIKATSLFGGVQIVNILILIIRSKVIATLLGPAGIGIASLLNSVIGLVGSFTDFGLQTSAVKEIAYANSINEPKKISNVLTIVRKLVWITGFIGLLLMVFLSSWLSELTFGNDDYSLAFVFLSITLLFKQLSVGQLVILQGLRKLKDLAKASVLGSLLGLLASLPFYYFYRLDGIVPAIIFTALISFIISWYFSNKIVINKVRLSLFESLANGKEMLKLGAMISLSGLLTLAVAYILRIYIRELSGVEQVGLYSAGFTILNGYVGLIFTALGKDYYPRLSSVSDNNKLFNKLMNQQGEITILIIAPILITFIVFINLIVPLLYSNEFSLIVPMLHLAAIGVFFKAGSWLVSFLFLSKGDGKLFFLNELFTHIYTLALNILLYHFYGLTGLGISYLLAYFLYLIQVIIVTKKNYSFEFELDFIKILIIQVSLASVTFLCVKNIENYYFFGVILITLSSWFSIKELNKRMKLRSLFKTLNKNGDD